jgi:ssDNA-specific exonuclease RecJ
VIDDHLLDIIGNEFKFDHEKGIAEWVKNSVDAYIRSNISDSEQVVMLRFDDRNKGQSFFECIDFNGMTAVDINKALKRWGDPEAAKRGLKKKVYGGHGNGGKFYMRQMFEKSHFVTYKNGLLNIFGFSEKKKYGFANDYKDRKINYSEALEIAEIDERDIPEYFLNKIRNGETGFTIVKGIAPLGMKNNIKVYKICEKLKKHPQSVRILERISVKITHNGNILLEELKPETVKPLLGFESPFVFSMPEIIKYEENEISFSNKKYPKGNLVLKTSEMALSNRFAELNRIDIIGEIGVIASYQLRELGLYYPQTDFIYGECSCPILEDPTDDCVMNDRSRLADNEKTKALLAWIKEKVKEICEKIAEKEEKERKDISKKVSSDFNNFLDRWKNKFMAKIFSDIFVGSGEGFSGGDGAGGSLGEHGSGNSNKDKHEKDQGGDDGGGDVPKKGSHFPRVLLSEYDEDPLNPESPLVLHPEHGLVYQRVQDVKEGIYWINTASPLANAIIKKYGTNSVRWRDYLFQRYVDIFIKEALLKLEKREPERFNAATIDGEILGKVVTEIHSAASKDLESFLFDEHYSIENERA